MFYTGKSAMKIAGTQPAEKCDTNECPQPEQSIKQNKAGKDKSTMGLDPDGLVKVAIRITTCIAFFFVA
jgi:hypothetical protein